MFRYNAWYRVQSSNQIRGAVLYAESDSDAVAKAISYGKTMRGSAMHIDDTELASGDVILQRVIRSSGHGQKSKGEQIFPSQAA